MVRERGLEPLCLAAVDFEPTTSTDSVTLAAAPSLPAKTLAEKATSDGLACHERPIWAEQAKRLPADARRAVRGNIGAGLGIEAGILHTAIPAGERLRIILHRSGLIFPRRRAAEWRVGRG